MEAALFTLDVFLLLVLIRAVRLSDRPRDPKRVQGLGLGLFSYLEAKTDEVQKGLGRRGKGQRDA
ncbi:hypothetical protein [Pseudorhodoferax sp. Leaf267]|uniref:hypothetical protein n=1 Tax=Pseudorhodoferax sp. Leaf267 TaxID=1736316 RepID=UPI0006F39135|nr:hypothetical protein [Pseudorhodoferax sp. Leaf267]KQP23150.1 hypothetical protein ASF43_04525 [Pseudorhodoferax sp. Leaf267]